MAKIMGIQTGGIIGHIAPFSGPSAPSYGLNCDGSAVSRSLYADLFSLIGTTYGVGDGSTTFNLPNMSGNVPVGPGGAIGASVGGSGGESTHVLSVGEMPSHNHNTTALAGGPSSSWLFTSGNFVTEQQVLGSTFTGGNGAHNNVQPFVCVNKDLI